MSARRGLCCLAVLASAVLLGGCATTVSGRGSLAQGVRVPASQSEGASGHPTGTGTPEPTGSTDGGGGGDNSSVGQGKVCSLFRPADLTTLFGEPVTAAMEGDDDRSCSFDTDAHGSIVVNVYDFLNMKDEAARDPGGRSFALAGRPAYQGQREILVARTSDPSAPGLIVASNLFSDEESRGDHIAESLLKVVVPKFSG